MSNKKIGKQASTLDLLTQIFMSLYTHTLLTKQQIMRKTLLEITKDIDMVMFNNCINVDPEIYCNVEA